MKPTSTPQPTETDNQPECSGAPSLPASPDLPTTPTPRASSKRSQNKPPTTSQEPSTKKRGRGRPRKTPSSTTFHPPKSHLPSSSRRSIRTSTVLPVATTMKPPIPTSYTSVPDLSSAPRHRLEKEEEEDLRLNILMVVAGTQKLDLAHRARAKGAAEVFLSAVREIQKESQQQLRDSADLLRPSCGTENMRARSMPVIAAATGPGELDDGLGGSEGRLRRPREGFDVWLGRKLKGEGDVVGKDAAEEKS